MKKKIKSLKDEENRKKLKKDPVQEVQGRSTQKQALTLSEEEVR